MVWVAEEKELCSPVEFRAFFSAIRLVPILSPCILPKAVSVQPSLRLGHVDPKGEPLQSPLLLRDRVEASALQ